MTTRLPRFLTYAAVLLLATAGASAADRTTDTIFPNVVVVTIDTLRTDHMSVYGYDRPTTPNLDGLIDSGIRFDRARTIEPLTGPALVSMLTSLHPHQHGASRNGLRMRSGMASLPKALQARGYRTAAFVGNWTLRDKLCGLAEHFESYNEVLTRGRWWGFVRREADANDITDGAIEWLGPHRQHESAAPFFLWVHYVEPHSPYRLHKDFVEPLGINTTGNVSPRDRYDTEIAFVDAAVGRLLESLDRLELTEETLIVFASDHGESLGEHGYWGHGRHLYEPTLSIPMSVTWKGHLRARAIDAPALITDIAPTILGLLGGDQPSTFGGFDWAGVLNGDAAPVDRLTHHQAHRGAVMSKHDSELKRRSGLLEVGIIQNEKKEIFRVTKNRREFYDLAVDPRELNDLIRKNDPPTEGLLTWMRTVYDGLTAVEDAPPEPLDEESIEALRSLGYVD
jgi:arylsulfatase A-like enzyme